MDSATDSIAEHLTRDTLVLYETTLPVGTTRTRWKPLLEKGSGLTEGRDFHVAFSPERVLTGRVFEDLRKYPKLVGGLSPAGAAQARAFYEVSLQFDDRPDLARGNGVWDLGSAEAAEMAKLAETTYRDVNIGLANQFAKFADKTGIDVYEVIEASNSQPYSHIHRPGVSVGGHCIPVYPRLYLTNDPDATVVRAARDANASMPEHTVRLLVRAYGDLDGAKVVVLGAAYRGEVKETAFSGVFDTVTALETRRAQVSVHDPLFSDDELRALGLPPHALGASVDAAILHTDHRRVSRVDCVRFTRSEGNRRRAGNARRVPGDLSRHPRTSFRNTSVMGAFTRCMPASKSHSDHPSHLRRSKPTGRDGTNSSLDLPSLHTRPGRLVYDLRRPLKLVYSRGRHAERGTGCGPVPPRRQPRSAAEDSALLTT